MSIVRSDRLAYAADAIFQSPVVYWCVHPISEILDNPDYFSALARTGRLRAGDEITVCRYRDDRRADVLEEVRLRVLAVDGTAVRVAPLGAVLTHAPAPDANPAPDATPAPAAPARAAASAPESGFGVKWRGPSRRYAVIGPDGAVIEDGFASREAARAHLAGLEAGA